MCGPTDKCMCFLQNEHCRQIQTRLSSVALYRLKSQSRENSDYNVIQNNIFGLKPNGLGKLPNRQIGIDLQWGASHNLVGGLGANEGNVLSGHPYGAVDLSHSTSTSDNEVTGNFIGTNLTGDAVTSYTRTYYGITFKERRDIPVYHPDVRVWEVFDADGSSLALYYGDYYLRPSKGGGAWCDTFVDQSRLLGWKPAVTNNTNFTRPAPGEPALLSSDNVDTLFHEFGHALHAMFQDVEYPTFSTTPRDFVEFPSAFNEHWAYEPSVFANCAKHSKTGEPMPATLVEKIKKAKTFNQGYVTTEYLASALLDMAWHSGPPGQTPKDVNAFEKATLEQRKLNLPQVPPRYRTTYFSHIWDQAYAAGYYAYYWSEVLDCDAYSWFEENGGMTRKNGDRFRAMILSRGGSENVAAMYRAFRGRDPIVQPFLEERGLTGGSGPQPGVKAKP